MAKAGRKRKMTRREKNGQPQRDGSRDVGTPEFQRHRARIVGADLAPDPRAGSALGILELVGVITASQAKAAADWARAMHATYGKPWPGCVNLEGLPGGTPQGPSEGAEYRARRGLQALDKCGWLTVREVRLIAWGNNLPGWYRHHLTAKAMMENGRAQHFVRGLEALEKAM